MMTVRNINLIYFRKSISNCTDISILMNTPYSMGNSIIRGEIIKNLVLFGTFDDLI